MAEQQQQTKPGGHYSGANPIPTVKQFVEKLDIGKKDRDKKIDSQRDASHATAKPHENKLTPKKNQKTVTDPVTGNEVVIENATKDMVKEVENPTVWMRII
jgi:hypothetical protein